MLGGEKKPKALWREGSHDSSLILQVQLSVLSWKGENFMGSAVTFSVLGLILQDDLKKAGKALHFHLSQETGNRHPGSYFPVSLLPACSLSLSPLLAYIHKGEQNTFQPRHSLPSKSKTTVFEILSKLVQ